MKGDTSELFEFNKMWLTFGLIIGIATAWVIKMIIQKEIKIQRTPLDIPILLFVLSQVISTILSWDPHVSIWGYYSRFNGGLLSILGYIFLYYAFVSNLHLFSSIKRILKIALAGGLIVALWGLPSHFGYDPTCLVFRGTLDVACWTADFQPKVRIFSTLGQPDWLAAYLTILIPIALGFAFIKMRATEERSKKIIKRIIAFKKGPGVYLALALLFYIDLLWTSSRSGFLAAIIPLFIFIAFLVYNQWKKVKANYKTFAYKNSPAFVFTASLILITFLMGQPFSSLNKMSLPGILENAKKAKVEQPKTETQEKNSVKTEGGTDSTKIRLIVWKGAFEAWKNNPIVGTGVETFAFAYYKHRPAEHNLVSEWNFLYNKAHNEYLNFLTTTGILGLGTYLAMIGIFLWKAVKKTVRTKEINNTYFISISLLAAYVSILITNFFGFSVVNVNIFFFLIPAFFFTVTESLPDKFFSFGKPLKKDADKLSILQIGGGITVAITGIFAIATLINFWSADRSYALGSNLTKTGAYQQGYQLLNEAVKKRPNEPVFQDELAMSSAIMAVVAASQKQENGEAATGSAELAQKFAEEAINTSNKVVNAHPKNVVFRKTQVRIYYTLSQMNPAFMPMAVEGIKKAYELAPTDANVSYNYGVLTGQNKELEKAIEILKKTVELKPDYRDAYYALGVFYNQLSKEKNSLELKKMGNDQMNFILENINPEDKEAKDALNVWN